MKVSVVFHFDSMNAHILPICTNTLYILSLHMNCNTGFRLFTVPFNKDTLFTCPPLSPRCRWRSGAGNSDCQYGLYRAQCSRTHPGLHQRFHPQGGDRHSQRKGQRHHTQETIQNRGKKNSLSDTGGLSLIQQPTLIQSDVFETNGTMKCNGQCFTV